MNQSSSSTPVIQSFEVRQSLNKGLGVFATRHIPAFTRIISEKPLISIAQGDDLPQISQQYEELPSEVKVQYMQYHIEDRPERADLLTKKLAQRGYTSAEVSLMVQVASVFQGNAFNVPTVDAQGKQTVKRALFPTVARLNHSCAPNAHSYFNHVTNSMDVHTLSDVREDEELEISYFNLLLPRPQRAERANAWQFKCTCPVCAGPDSLSSQLEVRRQRIRALETLYLNNIASQDFDRGQHIFEMEEMVTLAKQESALFPQLPKAYEYLAMSQIANVKDHPSQELIVAIVMNLRESMLAEANITGPHSPACEERRLKYEMMQGEH